jgi:hypothetical protein
VRPEGLSKFKNSPHRVSNPRPSGLYFEIRTGFIWLRIGSSVGHFGVRNETSGSVNDKQVFCCLADDHRLQKESATYS